MERIPPEGTGQTPGRPEANSAPSGAARGGPDLPPGGVGKERLREGARLLREYKQGKANLETRIVEDELWWQLRHWDVIGASGRARRVRDKLCGGQDGTPRAEPTSGWLFNTIINKHADAMDNYPEPVALPREQSDAGSAKVLSEVLPALMEQIGFEDTYSALWWEKLKHGAGAYGIFWNSGKDNGLGDIDIVSLDLLNVFWEPGITDIQAGANLFITELRDVEELEAAYPAYRGKFSDAVNVREYIYDDSVDNSHKRVVVDWYYKLRGADGAVKVHYIKFCGECLLFASENEREYRERGYYDHGMYPVVMDVLFPEKGTPVGFGYVAVCRDEQLYIDRLSANILENSMMNTRKRFFVSSSTGINEGEFLDWNRPLVHVEGELGEERIKEIVTQPLDSINLSVMEMKINEMKETAANRDVNTGGSGGGVTAASAISALQEAGNKVSRDMIAASYRAYTQVTGQVIELMRQFYTEARCFRILAPDGGADFVTFSGAALAEKRAGMGADGTELIRKPAFDLKIKAQKSSPFSRMERNARAQELYSMGFFAPENAQASLIALDMMDFEGIDQVREKVTQGQTLYNMLRQAMETIAALTGRDLPHSEAATGQGGGNANAGERRAAREADRAQEARTPLQQRMAARAQPSMDRRGNVT